MESLSNTKVKRVIFPPNKPMDRKFAFSTYPKLYNNMMFLDINKEGNWILGASNLVGSFWEGTLLYFKNCVSLKNLDFAGYYVYASTSDGKFINSNIVALAEDTGNINILSIDDDSKIRSISYFKLKTQVNELSVWDDSSKILSCSDKCIDLWEINSCDRKPLVKYDYCHLGIVNSVDTLKTNTNCFVSGSSDKTSCLWDLRAPSEVSVLYRNEFSSIKSVRWNKVDENYIVIGMAAGDIYLVDVREPKSFLSVLSCFEAPIHRMDIYSSKIAICGDTNEVVVAEIIDNCLTPIYTNTEHKDIVRDLKWNHNNTLYSCGFETCLLEHIQNKK